MAIAMAIGWMKWKNEMVETRISLRRSQMRTHKQQPPWPPSRPCTLLIHLITTACNFAPLRVLLLLLLPLLLHAQTDADVIFAKLRKPPRRRGATPLCPAPPPPRPLSGGCKAIASRHSSSRHFGACPVRRDACGAPANSSWPSGIGLDLQVD